MPRIFLLKGELEGVRIKKEFEGTKRESCTRGTAMRYSTPFYGLGADSGDLLDC